MSGRKRRDYRKVMQALVQLLLSNKVTTVVTDFEAGIWQGVCEVLPDITMRGCAFHFGQALWRKCVELGLKVAYERRDSVFKLLRKTFALPLLPQEDVPSAFDKLKQKNEDATLEQYLTYVETTWLNSTVWSPENWSVYGRAIRTNNDVEGWHNRLNRRAKKGNLPFYLLVELLVELLHGEAREIKHQCRLVKERKLERRQTRQTRTIQGRLWAVWEKYGKKEMSASELLSECGRLYGPVDRRIVARVNL